MIATTKTTKKDGEYRVRLFIDGKYQAGADYFTDDKADAIKTGSAMIRTAVESDKATDEALSEQSDYDNETENELDVVIFDVCNDYSLDIAPDQSEPDYNLYRMIRSEQGFVYIHKEYNEIHYLKACRIFNGEYLEM